MNSREKLTKAHEIVAFRLPTHYPINDYQMGPYAVAWIRMTEPGWPLNGNGGPLDWPFIDLMTANGQRVRIRCKNHAERHRAFYGRSWPQGYRRPWYVRDDAGRSVLQDQGVQDER